ncbi:MAG: phosphoglycerate kinase [Candidatus Dormibacteria bacterium]
MIPRLFTEAELAGRRVLLRAELNTPLEGGEVSDDLRIRESLPTLRALLTEGARVAICAHLGRPGGRPDPAFSLAPVARRMAEFLGHPVVLAPDCVGPGAEAAVEKLRPGQAVLLENLRFHAGEEANDPEFAAALARLGEVFVNDAFGVCHRSHASTVGVAGLLPAYAGLLVVQEVKNLTHALEGEEPRVAVIGGAKVAGKLEVLQSLIQRFQAVLIGGGMANTFLAAQGIEVGASRVETELLDDARDILAEALEMDVDVRLPVDAVVADRFDAAAEIREVSVDAVPEGWLMLDIGPESAAYFADAIEEARTLFWNGPMGVFEMEPFASGTREVALAIADCEGYTVVGGGDTAAAIDHFDLEGEFDHVSTGGGAALEFVAQKSLPGLEVIPPAGGGSPQGGAPATALGAR